jgi:anti-sigma regulatory factor (Ser/Thr protein kinase)
MEVPGDEDAPGTVRDALDRSTDIGWVLGDVLLVASELVTNAVLHSGCSENHRIHVDVRRESEQLMIVVRDPGLSRAEAEQRQRQTAGGWGLVIVDQLAQRSGTERTDGYCVWAEVALP